MSNSSNWLAPVRQSLHDALWAGYEHAPQWMVDAAGKIKPWLQVLSDRRVPLSICRGPIASGTEASLLVAGEGHSIEYVVGRFFARPPARQALGTTALPNLPRALRRWRESADMTIAQVPSLASQWLGGNEYLQVPPWVGAWLDVPDDPEAFARQRRRVWDELRPVRHHGLRPEISHQVSEFDRFYEEIYLPYARHRYSQTAVVRPLQQLRRLFRHGGGLIWICKGEQRIAGALYWQDGKALGMISLGLAGTGEAARKMGAIAAIYYFGMQHAKALGCTELDFGGCRPSPSDGVLFFKRKWGMRLAPRLSVTSDLLVRWERPNAAVRTFLAGTPLIIHENAGLSLVAVPDDGDAAGVRDQLWMEGLQRLFVLRPSPAMGDSPMPGLVSVESRPGPAPAAAKESDAQSRRSPVLVHAE